MRWKRTTYEIWKAWLRKWKTLAWNEPRCTDCGISLLWGFVEYFAEQADGLRSKNSGKQKRPFLRICSTCPVGYRLTIPLGGCSLSSIRSSLKPVLCHGSKG